MNTEQARFNMIEQQIRPWNVLDKHVLDMLVVVKREDYFSDEQKSLVFFDTELPLPGGTKAMTPKFEARILQELQIKKGETVLLLGAASGYLAALLAYAGRHVTVLETQADLLALAEKNLHQNGVRNVKLLAANIEQHKGEYDVIIAAGSFETVPDSLKQQLNVGGRLFAVAGQEPIMHAQLWTRTSPTEFASRELFDTVLPRLAGVKATSAFSF